MSATGTSKLMCLRCGNTFQAKDTFFDKEWDARLCDHCGERPITPITKTEARKLIKKLTEWVRP